MADPRVTGLVVLESREALVDLESTGIMRFDDRKRSRNPHVALVREELARRLEHATRLLPAGFGLLGIEGYRPPSLQRLFYDSYAERLRACDLGLDEEAFAHVVSRFVAPPHIAPHPTGAAIDLTLCDQAGIELDLGSAVDANPEVSAGRCYTSASGLPATAAKNRAILVEVLHGAGLVNYPTEWWHWSFGDRYWAMSTGENAAIYGPVDLPGTP